MSRFVNATGMVQDAKKGKYAIGHFNINNLEWAKAILQVAQETKSPIILGVSLGAVKYMGGFRTVYAMTHSLMQELNITVPVALHLDHGPSVKDCFDAIDAKFSSVMFDGSHYNDLQRNLIDTAKVVKYAKKYNVSVEAEVGTIGGEEDGIVGNGDLATPIECQEMEKLGIDFLAAGINNIHGKYPKNWSGLRMDVLKQLSAATRLPLVLHGGSGIDIAQVQKAIKNGISKINVNTELQIAFQQATRSYIQSNRDLEGKGYDPRQLLAPGFQAIKEMTKKLLKEFGSLGKAK